MAAFLVFIVFLFVCVLIAMIPSFIILLCYDFIAPQLGWVVLEVTFLNVLCFAVLLGFVVSVLQSIFGKK